MSTIPTISPFPLVKVVMVEYDSVTGEPLRTLDSLNFERTSPNFFCTPIVIKMNVSGVTKITNIRLGLIKSFYPVTSDGTLNSDGSMSIGNFGFEQSTTFTPKTSLSSFFSAINENKTTSDSHNIKINNLSDNGTGYIYLSLKTNNSVDRGYVGYKWFFDFI